MRVKTKISSTSIMFYQSGHPKQKIGAMCMCDDAARLNTVKTYLIIFYTSCCWINCIISYKFYQYFFDYNTYESGFESLSSNLQSLSVWNRLKCSYRQ